MSYFIIIIYYTRVPYPRVKIPSCKSIACRSFKYINFIWNFENL